MIIKKHIDFEKKANDLCFCSNLSVIDVLEKSLNNVLLEGIDFDVKTMTVSYNQDHEKNVDTSEYHNPTYDITIYPKVKVWSIFKRKHNNLYKTDGNPLIYALKGENGWKFRSKEDKDAILNQFDKIANKFVKNHRFNTTIVVPSGNGLNMYIANNISSKCKNVKIIKGVVCKMTTNEVDDIVLEKKSKFRKYYKDSFNEAYTKLSKYLIKMDKHRRGFFTRHFIEDDKMRDILDFTFKLSKNSYAEYANKINDQDVLIIDDTISRGQSIKDICNIIQQNYNPKSITVLTLLSRLK